jgi:hypothetical protein
MFLNDLPAAVVSPAIPIPMVFHDPDMICGIGRNLCFVRPGTTARFEETPEPIEARGRDRVPTNQSVRRPVG